MIISTSIPISKWNQFHEIVKATGGRYLCDPLRLTDCVMVRYETGPETESRWLRCIEDVKEVRKDQWWRRLGRRLWPWRKA